MSLSLLDPAFLALLLAVGLLRRWVPAGGQGHFGLLASAGLIGLASPATLAVIAGLALGYLYPTALAIRRLRWSRQQPLRARWLLLAAVLGLVAIMVVFKLDRHFTLPWFGEGRVHAVLGSLIGFSYFLFKAINYLYMHYLLDLPDRGPATLLHFALFPSTITSGPIQKYQEFRAQAAAPLPLDRALLLASGYRVTRGLFRKLCLAYALDGAVAAILARGELNAPWSALLVACLYLYFYFDFAGYSDLAIGFGGLLGFKVPENFKEPFRATSITEFWRNWHVSLGDWFRDHVFIPLGGMRLGGVRAAALAFAIMFLCGLWHGLTLPFLAWGLWHGSNIFVEGILGVRPVPRGARGGVGYWARVASTNARTAFGAVFFLPSLDATRQVLLGFVTWS